MTQHTIHRRPDNSRPHASLPVDPSGIVRRPRAGVRWHVGDHRAAAGTAREMGSLRARTPQRNGLELWTWVLEPGDVHDVEAAQRVDQLFLFTDGRLDIVTGNTVLALSVGDSASIRTDVGHRYMNTGADTCKFVQVSRSVER